MKKQSKSVAIISDQRLRDYMEDTHSFDANFTQKGWVFGGVYDGHGTEKPAVTAARRIPEAFRKYYGGISAEDAFFMAYEEVSVEMSSWAFCCGTCAANFFIKGKQIHYANVGDARILVLGEKVVELTTDHRLTNSKELARVKKAGGETAYYLGHQYVYNGRYLMPTRTLGDQLFKSVGVIYRPSVGSYSIKPTDRFLVAATDGLFDEVSNAEVLEVARGVNSPELLAETLRRRVVIADGKDNLTIIVFCLFRPR